MKLACAKLHDTGRNKLSRRLSIGSRAYGVCAPMMVRLGCLKLAYSSAAGRFGAGSTGNETPLVARGCSACLKLLRDYYHCGSWLRYPRGHPGAHVSPRLPGSQREAHGCRAASRCDAMRCDVMPTHAYVSRIASPPAQQGQTASGSASVANSGVCRHVNRREASMI